MKRRHTHTTSLTNLRFISAGTITSRALHQRLRATQLFLRPGRPPPFALRVVLLLLLLLLLLQL
jgi:hypothetical protein